MGPESSGSGERAGWGRGRGRRGSAIELGWIGFGYSGNQLRQRAKSKIDLSVRATLTKIPALCLAEKRSKLIKLTRRGRSASSVLDYVPLFDSLIRRYIGTFHDDFPGLFAISHGDFGIRI